MSENPRIVFVFDSITVMGGIGKASAYLIEELSHLAKVAVIAPDSVQNREFWSKQDCEFMPTSGLPKWELDTKRPISTMQTLWHVRKEIRRRLRPTDVLVSTHLGTEILLGLGNPFPHNKRIFIVHNTNYSGLSKKLLVYSLRSCRVTIAINHLTSKTAMSLGNPAVKIIPNCVPSHLFRNDRHTVSTAQFSCSWPFRLAIVGPVTPLKNQALALEAYTLLSQNKLKYRLFIKGASPLFMDNAYFNELQRKVESYDLSDCVEFMGYCNVLEELYKDVDILLSLSSRESFGMTILEAMAMGIPVISTRSGGPNELISSGKNGFLIASDPIELATAIDKLASDRDLYAQISLEARTTARNYDAKLIAVEFWNAVLSLE